MGVPPAGVAASIPGQPPSQPDPVAAPPKKAAKAGVAGATTPDPKPATTTEPQGPNRPPPGPSDAALPAQVKLDPPPQASATVPPRVQTAQADGATVVAPSVNDAPTSTMDVIARRFNADLKKLPPAEQDGLRKAYEQFTRTGATRGDADAFLRTLGTALTHDRQRILSPLGDKPEDAMVRLAPAIMREAALLKTARAAQTLLKQTSGFELMKGQLLTAGVIKNGDRDISRMTEADVRDPKVWASFRDQYLKANPAAAKLNTDDEEINERSLGDDQRQNDRRAMIFVRAMDVFSQPNDKGETPLQRAAPAALVADAKAELTKLAASTPELQAFTPKQVEQMASGFAEGVKVTPTVDDQGRMTVSTTFTDPLRQTFDLANPPAVGADSRANYDAMIRGRMKRDSIAIMPNPLSASETFRQLSPLTIFQERAQAQLRGLGVAEKKLANGELAAADILPLAMQAQGAVDEDRARREAAGLPTAGVDAGAAVLKEQVDAELARVKKEKYAKVGTALAGAATGVGLLVAGPAGWGVGVTAALATAGAAATGAQAYFDWKDYQHQVRSGGIDVAGLNMSGLPEADRAALFAKMGLSVAGSLGGVGAVTNAARLEQVALRLKYAAELGDALSVPAAARQASIAKFLESRGIMGDGAAAIAKDFVALDAPKQVVATRLLERFGPETRDAKVLGAVLSFAAVNAEINNANGAVANVDHMYAAYLAANTVGAQRLGRPLTDTEKTINLIATIGTDGQGKFGHTNLPIIQTTTQDGHVITSAPDHLRTIRQQAVDAAFEGAPDSMKPWRDRMIKELADEENGGAVIANFQKIMADAKADPAALQRLQQHFVQTGLVNRIMPFTQGAYVHNNVSPQLVYEMAIKAGLNEEQAAKTVVAAQMHGFGNAFVAGAYPGVPSFRGVMIPGTNRPMFSPDQIAKLENVAKESLAWNQEIQPSVAQAKAWGIATDPPPRGANQIFLAAMRANEGHLPPGLQQWITDKAAPFRAAKADAGFLAAPTEGDNLGNYVPEGMRKWASIFSHNPSLGNADTLGHQLERLRFGASGYLFEEEAAGNAAIFKKNFSEPADRMGLFTQPGDATYHSVVKPLADGSVIINPDAPRSAIVSASAAIKARFGSSIKATDPYEVVKEFYNNKEASMKTALAELSEGNLGPAFDRNLLFTGGANPAYLLPTQLLIAMQTGNLGVRSYVPWDGR